MPEKLPYKILWVLFTIITGLIIAFTRVGVGAQKWTLEEMIAEENKVAARFSMSGTHLGEFFGVPATGKSIRVQAINFYRLAGDQIVEEYGQPDMLGLLAQIGAGPK
jgi:predicted ester cyclase